MILFDISIGLLISEQCRSVFIFRTQPDIIVELLEKIISGFQLLDIFAKSSNLDICLFNYFVLKLDWK